jgi:hypothetical protein
VGQGYREFFPFIFSGHILISILLKYDMSATINHPPNSLSFDPRTRSRSLFQTPKTRAGFGGAGSGEGILHAISSMLSDARVVMGHQLDSTTPSNPTAATALLVSNPPSSLAATVISSSPPKNSPTKLPRFLQYAEEHEGIANATMFEYSLSEKGFGPDVIMMDDIDKNDLISCGLNAGDAIRLKRAARTWWTSPDAKRTRQRSQAPASPTPKHPIRIDDRERIRFEKRYANDSGSVSVFGPGIIPGQNHRAKQFVWWFYNSASKAVEKVPDCFIPDIDPEYLNPDPLYEPTPSPQAPSTQAD